MKIRSITAKAILITTLAFLFTAVGVILVADHQHRAIIDRSQTELFSERLATIMGSLERTYARLQDTLQVAAYEEDFQQSFLAAFRNDYYDQAALQIFPFIVDAEGRHLAHPWPEQGSDPLADETLINRLVDEKEGSFEYRFDGQNQWVIFRTFEPWNWVVAYVVPTRVKYAEARLFTSILVLIMAAITFVVLVVVSLAITRVTRPIVRLTEASAQIAAGNLAHPIDVSGHDELGLLARSFAGMRDAIRAQMADLAGKNEALLLEIAERERAEEALRESEERFRALVQNSSDIFVILEADGKVRFVSPSVERILGYRPEFFVGQDPTAHLHPNNVSTIREGLAAAIAKPGQPIARDMRIRHADGSWVHFETIINGLLDNPSIQGVVINARDITERQRLEMQFRQVQKMEAIGQLAGGVAHDFNNLLTAIRGYTELLLRQIQPTDPLRADLKEIEAAAERAAQLTRQLLAFSRKQVLRPQLLDLNEVIGGMENMLRRLIGEAIELRTVLDPALGRVRADPGQIEQVIMNLAINARDAMPHGGRLALETRNTTLDEAYAQEHLEVEPGAYVLLAVSDTGVGMEEAVLSRLFEPFFTTKEWGKGTGLGLATVHGIVKQSGGHIAVYSEVGHGTTFKVYLPWEGAQPAEPVRREQRSVGLPHGVETILVVEDEEAVRQLTCRVLRRYGYQVLEAKHPAEALTLSENHPGPIHLAVTDVVMPQMGGPDLAEHLLASRPSIQVLYTSGYTDNMIVHQGVLEPGVAFLPKPFTPAELVQKVRELLDGADAQQDGT